MRALAQRMLDAPQLYMSTDADPLVNRGGKREICARGTVTLVNPGTKHVESDLAITFRERESAAKAGRVGVGNREAQFSADKHVNVVPVTVAPGVTKLDLTVETPGVRCKSVPSASLPTISVALHPDQG